MVHLIGDWLGYFDARPRMFLSQQNLTVLFERGPALNETALRQSDYTRTR